MKSKKAEVIVKTERGVRQILNLLEEIGTLNVGDLADRFAVRVSQYPEGLDELRVKAF